jgi:hypothetical protein
MLTLTDPSSRSTSVAPSPSSCSATDSNRSSASAAAPAAAPLPGLQRSTATARSFSSLQSCSSVLPTVLLGALSITQSPGCKGNARQEQQGRTVVGVDQLMLLLPAPGLPSVAQRSGQQPLWLPIDAIPLTAVTGCSMTWLILSDCTSTKVCGWVSLCTGAAAVSKQ